VLLINKIDLLGAGAQIDFDIERVKTDARKLNKGIEIFPISAKTGAGFTRWYNWLKKSVKNIRGG
jgi:hydrogenase nickel incorporation protein HypB